MKSKIKQKLSEIARDCKRNRENRSRQRVTVFWMRLWYLLSFELDGSSAVLNFANYNQRLAKYSLITIQSMSYI